MSTPISRWARMKFLNDAEWAILAGLVEGPGGSEDRRSVDHLVTLGLVERFGSGGYWLALTSAGREAVAQ